MKRQKISIIGCGNIGSSVSSLCIPYGYTDVSIIDNNAQYLKGKIFDIQHGFAAIGSRVNLLSSSDDYSIVENSDVIIITAGVSRSGGNKDLTRDDLFEINRSIIKDISIKVSQYVDNALVIIITNPLDLMVYEFIKNGNFNPKKVLGMGGLLDSIRFKSLIADECNISIDDIEGMVIGAHNDTMIPLVSLASVNGKPLLDILSSKKINQIIKQTKSFGGDITKLVGYSAFLSPAICSLTIADNYIKNTKNTIPCSVMLSGEYNIHDKAIGVPVVIGSNGIESIKELNLNDDEKELFKISVESVRI